MTQDSSERVGQVLDGCYSLRRTIAKTGLSVVYEAVHRYTDRTVAVKLMHAQSTRDPRARERFFREARFLSAGRHPGIVEVLDAGESPDGQPYIVMEMLEGRSLDGLLTTRGTLAVARVVRIGVQMCEALAHVHARGVVHADVKPSNIVLPSDAAAAPKLIDFGIAVFKNATPLPKSTAPDELMGSPEYMAPEQLFGQPTETRCDVYSLGVTLYECLTAQVPFSGGLAEVRAKLAASASAPSPKRVRPDVPETVAEVVVKALVKIPGRRFPDVVSLGQALEKSLSGAPPAEEAPPADVVGRRRFRRAPYVTLVRVIISDQNVLDGRSEDISEGGMLIIGPNRVENETAVRVRFASPESGVVATVLATARWVRAARDGKGAIGVEFKELDPVLRKSIARYVELVGGEGEKGGR